ncbi:Pollen-specific protein C13 [Dendrobium catenatum]|uniref:Pollen-specific protein C13 n=1 Tax=Dendrobium catenatum TaxID=906689 RepID=A0A2I0VU34_9ASPA|nr:Pollen-specific protein C13 [Dendrobium catenatum]
MAKIVFIVALCLFSSIALVASANSPVFSVVGRVYCDNCHAGFETNITEYITGATIKVECTHFATGNIEHTSYGVTDSTGNYKIEVADDHEEEICEVVLVESPLENCNKINDGRDRAQVVLSTNTGMSNNARFANSLAFLKDEPLPMCEKFLRDYYGMGEEA